MFNIVIFGAPGSGKGTQSEALIERYGFRHISTGDLLRAEIKSGTALGRTAKLYIDKGQLVPDDMIIKMIEHLLEELKHEKGFIFDGFPRTVAQAEALNEMLKHHDKKIDAVLDMDVPEEELIQRLLNRGKVSGRSDDNIETIKHRLEVYHKQTAPIAAFYKKQGVHKPVLGTGSVDEIGARIAQIIESL